jgi:hypothetical protein
MSVSNIEFTGEGQLDIFSLFLIIPFFLIV